VKNPPKPLASIASLVSLTSLASLTLLAIPAGAQVRDYEPVTDHMLEHPSADDWLMFSRTYDAQRFSPLEQIDTHNVQQLRMAWSRGFGPGQTETVPIVHDGIMYVIAPGAIVQALDATSGDLLWEYRRDVSRAEATRSRTKALAIYRDVIVYAGPGSYIVGLDARTGALRWETKTDGRENTSGAIIADGKVISGGACAGKR
jgi:alcohol dehydrogenase (cytochrome c)